MDDGLPLGEKAAIYTRTALLRGFSAPVLGRPTNCYRRSLELKHHASLITKATLIVRANYRVPQARKEIVKLPEA